MILVSGLTACSSKSDGKGGPDGYVWGESWTEDTPFPEDGAPQPDGSTPGCVSSQDCPAELPFCDQISQMCVECKKNDDCDSDPAKPTCSPITHSCVECVMDTDCKTEYMHCLDGTCSDKACFPNSAVCVGNTVYICSPDGMDPQYETISCGAKTCYQGKCLECEPNKNGCKDNKAIKCNEDGSNFVVTETCAQGLECFGGKCMYCYPGDKKCEGNVAMACNTDGTQWQMAQDCSTGGLSCYMGACLSPCSGDIKQNTNAGCEFYAVDLDNAYEIGPDGNAYDAQNAQFAIIASNTSKDQVATVTVTYPDGQKKEQQVQPMSLAKFEPPATWSLDNTEKSFKSYRVNSTVPITVYQFNPLSNKVQVFSNDASVLLPAPALGSSYRVMTWGHNEGGSYHSYFTVVGVSSVPVQVTFVPTVATMDGPGVPSVAAGAQSPAVELKQGEVLNIESQVGDMDLSGTLVTATGPVAVFGGHEATAMMNLCCADHLEEQLMPIDTWGTHYLISQTWARWKEKDHVRIMAAEDGTNVTLNPAVAMVPTLAAGKYFSFQTNVNVEITANKPIQVAQYLASSFEILGSPNVDNCFNQADCPPTYECDPFMGMCSGPSCSSIANCPSGHTCEQYPLYGGACEPIGDPDMIMAVAEEQFMDSYVFLVPDAYLQDYVNVIAPMNAQKVVLDSMQIPPESFVPIGASGYGVFRKQMGDGVHTLWSDAKVGIMVYGYDNDVSYGYPGGMGLVKLEF